MLNNNPEELYVNLRSTKKTSITISRRIKKLEEKLQLLTPSSLSRWDIIISILKLTVENLNSKGNMLILCRELIEIFKPRTTYVYHVIDLLNKQPLPVIISIRPKYPHDVFCLNVPTGLSVLREEVKTWGEISLLKPLTELQSYGLKVIRQLLQEIQTLIERSSRI